MAARLTSFYIVAQIGQLDVDGDGVVGVDDVQDVVAVAHLLFVVGEESKGVLNLFGESEAYDVLHRPVGILDDIVQEAGYLFVFGFAGKTDCEGMENVQYYRYLNRYSVVLS